MSVLDEVLAAIDAADRDAAMTEIRAAFDTAGTLSGSIPEFADTVGGEVLARWCEAYNVDPADVLEAASSVGNEQALALVMVYHPALRAARAVFAHAIAGGFLTGLRAGLMVADEQSRAGA